MCKKFEERKWKREETFNNYVHEKVILGNRVPIDDDEISEYIIDGIPDPILRDQARVSGHKTKTSLLEAFQRVTLQNKKFSGTRSNESKEKVSNLDKRRIRAKRMDNGRYRFA